MRTAQREVLEETGIPVQIIGFLGMWLDEYGGTKRTLNIYYHAVPAKTVGGMPDTTEVVEIAWFAAAELPERLAFPGHVPATLEAWKSAATSAEFVTALLDQPANLRTVSGTDKTGP